MDAKTLRSLVMLVLILLIGLSAAFSGIKQVNASGSGGTTTIQQSAISQSSFTASHCTPTSCPVGGQQDTEIADGGYANNYIVMTQDGSWVIYLKGGGGTLYGRFSPDQLFGTSGINWCGDSRILYDTQTQKWFAEILEMDVPNGCGTSNYGHVDIGVSYNNDPTTPFKLFNPIPWKLYKIMETDTSATNWFPDHPEIAVSSDKLVITANAYNSSYNPLYWAINKNDLATWASQYHIQQPGYGTFSCDYPYQITPIRAINPSTPQYLTCPHYNSGKYDIQLFSVDGLPQSIHIPTSKRVIASITPPPSIMLPNGGSLPYGGPANGNWEFTQNGYWSQGILWFATPDQCNPGDGNHSCIHLTQVATGTSGPPLQDFDWGLAGYDLYLPTVTIDGFGDLAFNFGYTSASAGVYPSIGISGQAIGDPLNTVSNYAAAVIGSSYSSRFFDYYGAAPDPGDPTATWTVGGYQSSTDAATLISKASVVGVGLSMISQMNIPTGTIQNTQVTIRAAGSFSGTVGLGAVVACSCSTGLPVTINPVFVQLSLGGSNTTTVSLDARNVPAGGYYTLQVSAQAPNIYLTLTIPVNVVYFDFTMTVSPSSVSMYPTFSMGDTETTTLTLTISPGATSFPLSFSNSGQPSYLQISYSPSPATPTVSGTSVTVTFTIPPGGRIYYTNTYTVTITASGSGASHSVSVSLTVHADCNPVSHICYE